MLRTVGLPLALAGAVLVVLIFVLLNRSGGDDGPGDAATATATATPTEEASPSGDLQTALNGLGVDTAPSDRVAPDREALPSDYSPLGSSPSFGDQAEGSDESSQNKTDELLIVGMEIAGAGSNLALIEKDGVQIDGDGGIDPGATSVLHSLSEADNAWVTTTGARQGDSDDTRQLRAVAAGDVDRDGFEEVVVVFVDTSSADRVLKLRIIDDLAEGFAEFEDVLGDGDEILDVAIVTGDFDGDGTAQIAVGIGFGDSAELRFLQKDNGSYSFDSARTKSYGISFPDRTIVTLELTSGNLDYDNPDELGLVVNEFHDPGGGGPEGASTFLRLRRWQHRLR